MLAPSDVFLSYPRKDQESVRGLAAVLKAEGLTVWMDESNVDAFDHIHDRVASGIANSRAVLAWYSHNYATSRPCQWELSAAWLCEDGERILVVNPEPHDHHVQPRSLVNRLYVGASDFPAIARQVKSHIARFNSLIGDSVSFSQPMHYGRQLTGSNHFVGRIPKLWELHDALTTSGATMLTGTTRSIAQLRGFGGVGKSVLAEEYALRFGAAYPGGIFWLKAYGNNDDAQPMRPEDRDSARLRQISRFASQMQIPVEGKQPRRAFEYCRAKLGEDSVETCCARSGVAMVLLVRGDSAGAREIFETIAPVFERSLPPGDSYRIGAQVGLAFAAAAQGDLLSARQLCETALFACASANGSDHSLTLHAKAALCQILHAQGDLPGAKMLQQEVSDARLRIAESSDLDRLTDEFLTAQLMIGSGEFESVAPIIEKAAKVFQQELGQDNAMTLQAKLLLVMLPSTWKDAQAARQLASELVPRFGQIYGPTSPATLQARFAEAATLLLVDQSQAAQSLLEPAFGQS